MNTLPMKKRKKHINTMLDLARGRTIRIEYAGDNRVTKKGINYLS